MRRLERSLSDDLGRDLGRDIVLAITDTPLDRAELTSGERTGLSRLGSAERTAEWLRGRAALRSVLAERNESLDSSGLRFPNARYSLAHSDELAVAVGAHACGVGVDFEHFKPMREQAARFFLTDRERTWIGSLPGGERSVELLRLWTVKEALFKADVRNTRRTLRDYCVLEPWVVSGFAWAPDYAPQRYTTRRTAGGFLTVAITRGDRPCWPRTTSGS